MFPIEQSAFLQALGRAIGNSLWQVAAIWLLYAATTGLFTLKACRKYQVATLASLIGFLWFAGTFFYAYVNAPLPGYSAVYSITEATENVNRTSFANQALYLYHSILASLKSLSPYISCGYLLVFLILGIRLVNGFRQVKFFATEGLEKVDVQWRLFVQRNAEILQIRQHVKVFSSHYVQSPLTMGFWRPIILLPVASLNSLNTQQVEAILLHELAHIRRHDYLVNIFVQIAEICLFFNPFMRLLLKQIRQERENSCDDYVLQFQYNAKDYAKALLTIEKNNTATLLALSAKDNQSFQLLRRVRRIVAPQPHAFNYRQQLYLLLLLTILGLGFTVIIPKPKIKLPVVNTSQPINYSAKKEAKEVKTKTLDPVVPAAFDLVKTIQGFTENLNLKEIETQAKELGKDAEEMGKAYGENVEKQMQPYIEEVTNWAEKILDNKEATLKLEAAAKDLENLGYNEKTTQFANIEDYLAPAILKLEEALKTFPKMNIKIAPPNFTIFPPAAAFTNPLGVPTVPPLDSRMAEEKVRMANSRLRQTVENEQAKIEMKKAAAANRMQFKTQINTENNALRQLQKNKITINFNNNILGKYLRKTDENDTQDEMETDAHAFAENEDVETSLKDVFAKGKLGIAKSSEYALKLPKLMELKNLVKGFHYECNPSTPNLVRNRNSNVEKRFTITSSYSQNFTTKEELEKINEEDIDADDTKTIDIQQKRHYKKGKIENVVIIRIIPSR